MSQVSSAATQAAYFEHTAAVRERSDLCVLRIEGEDARSWLNGQVTNDVRGLHAGDGAYGLVVTAKGKVMADVWVLDRGEILGLAVPLSTRPALLARFETQIVMEDVAIADEPSSVLSVQGPKAREVIALAAVAPERVHGCDELGRGGVFVSAAPEEKAALLATLVRSAERVGGGAVDDAGFELARIRIGRPRFGVDFSDRNYPQEAGLKDLAVSFSKGCYLGQEVVCTIEHRGQVNRYLVRLESSVEPRTGDTITDADGSEVGAITSVVRDPERDCALALGYVKRPLACAGQALRAGDAVLTVHTLAGQV